MRGKSVTIVEISAVLHASGWDSRQRFLDQNGCKVPFPAFSGVPLILLDGSPRRCLSVQPPTLFGNTSIVTNNFYPCFLKIVLIMRLGGLVPRRP